MKNLDVVEGNLRAIKCSSDFGGPNMWDLRSEEHTSELQSH